MLDDAPKHPCLTSGPGGGQCPDYGNGYKNEPCASCLLPELYDEELNRSYFPTMAFLRDSSKFGKEKRKMSEKQEKNINDIVIT